MHGTRFSGADVDDESFAVLIDETNHRARNLLAMIEAAIRQTQSTNVEDYRAKLMARISSLRGLYSIAGQAGDHNLAIAELIKQTLHPYCSSGARVIAAGPDLLSPAEIMLCSAPRLQRAGHECQEIRCTELRTRPYRGPVENPTYSRRLRQTRSDLDRARRTGGGASAASWFRFATYQESTWGIRWSAAGLQPIGSHLFDADQSR
jgi:hypothetical protein